MTNKLNCVRSVSAEGMIRGKKYPKVYMEIYMKNKM